MKKQCPILSAGLLTNYRIKSSNNYPNPFEKEKEDFNPIECLSGSCALWNEKEKKCGLVTW